MPSFGSKSKERLETLHPDLREVLECVIEFMDFSVLCGHRSDEDQNAMYNEGMSKARAGESKHNVSPSLAVDIAPYPIDWTDELRFALLAGRVLQAADDVGVTIRWGGDWNMDNKNIGSGFKDLPHFELGDTDD